MTSLELLNKLNADYLRLHEAYEWNYRNSYMGDKTVDEDFIESKKRINNFKTGELYLEEVQEAFDNETNVDVKKRLSYWLNYFSLYRCPEELKSIRDKVALIEKKVESNVGMRETGYYHPSTRKFITMSTGSMLSKMRVEEDEEMRKALFDGAHMTMFDDLDDLVEMVGLQNEYARSLGFKHFYDYKTRIEEQMDCEEIWKIFDSLYEGATQYFNYIDMLCEKDERMKKPRNRSFLLSGDFVKEEHPYFAIEDSLERWGRSMMNLGVSFQGSVLKLDILERIGKLENGFCHQPRPVSYDGDIRNPMYCNFSCDNNVSIIGEGISMHDTLFHEGGHALHFANCNMKDVILNAEFPPTSTAWAETQSMFMDTMCSSAEWRSRYAVSHGAAYPIGLYESKLNKLWILSPGMMLGIVSMTEFQRRIYTHERLSPDIIKEIVKDISLRYGHYDTPNYSLLSATAHLYDWPTACSYHAYGLAELAVHQLRAYFYQKYGYIVDNPKIGEEMTKWRNVGSSISFNECLKGLTGEGVSTKAYLSHINRTVDQVLETAKERIAKLESIPQTSNPIDIGASISIVDGKDIVCDNSKSFEDMCNIFRKRIESKKE